MQQSSAVRTAGATRVADQIKLLTKFIFLLGGVAKGIEAMDDAARRNETSPALLQQAQQNKAVVKTTIQNVRDGLDKLEIDFRATPELQPYYIKLAGVANGAATAEQQAAANQFDAAGRSLLNVVNHLTDVLLAMR
jgi:GTP1/Obg family GTP-binding protein